MNYKYLGERISFVVFPKLILLVLTEYSLKNMRQEALFLKLAVREDAHYYYLMKL